MDAEQDLDALHDQVMLLVDRQADPTAGHAIERRFDVLAAEVRADAPLVDVAHAAGTGLIRWAAEWDDLDDPMASTIGELFTYIDARGATATPTAPIAGDEVPGEATDAVDAAAPEEIGGPIYPGEGIGGPIYGDDD